jgi:hypothetical protein
VVVDDSSQHHNHQHGGCRPSNQRPLVRQHVDGTKSLTKVNNMYYNVGDLYLPSSPLWKLWTSMEDNCVYILCKWNTLSQWQADLR